MISPDLVNGLFEGLGALLILRNIQALYRDKIVRGVTLAPVVFWSAWGFWNLFYYPSLDQWFSFYGGVGVMTTNTIWVCMAVYYRQAEKDRLASEAARAAGRKSAHKIDVLEKVREVRGSL